MDYDGWKVKTSEFEISSDPVITKTKLAGPFNDKDVWQGQNTEPIPFSDSLAHGIRREVMLAFDSGNPLLYVVASDITNICGNEVKRFICALDAYNSQKRKTLSLAQLIYGILDENFADYLKKVRSKAIITSGGGTHDEDPGPAYHALPTFKIEDVGEVFNFKYWINWTYPVAGDLEYAQIPVKIDGESLKLFKESCLKLLREVKSKHPNIPEVTEYEVLSSLSSSSCVDTQGKRTKLWREKEKHNSFSTYPLKGWVTYVQKAPLETREALTLKVDQSNSVKIIEKQLYYIVKDMEGSNYHANPDVFEERLDKFYNSCKYFFNRDLTKEGITKPRQLVKVMLDACKEVFPSFKAWDYSGIYSGLTLVFPDGKVVETQRGHGLGMGNALTTFMQCAAVDAYCSTVFINSEIKSLAFNDDISIGSDDREDMETYIDGEADFLRSLGLLPKGTKTWYGTVCILCERYRPLRLNEKASMKAYARRIPFSACNILTAKHLANLCLDPTYGDPDINLYNLLISFFGTESGDPSESTIPFVAGGWMNFKIANVDCSFFEQPAEVPFKINLGSRIGPPKLKPENFHKEEGLYQSPYEKSNIFIPPLPPEVESRCMIRQERSKVAALFHRHSQRHEIESWLRKELIRRRSAWREHDFPLLYWREILEYCSKNSLNDILPPRAYVKCKSWEEASEEGTGRFYSANPIQSAVDFYQKEVPNHAKSVPWPVYDGSSSSDIISRKVMQSSEKNYNLPGSTLLMEPKAFIGHRILKERTWKDSYKVWTVWQALTGSREVPINPWPIAEAAIHQRFSQYEFHVERNWHIYEYTHRVSWKITRLMVKDPSFLDLLMEAEAKEEEGNLPEEEPEEYIPESFSEWRALGSPVFKHPFYKFFCDGSTLLEVSGINKDLFMIRSSLNQLIPYSVTTEEEEVILTLCQLEKSEWQGFTVYDIKGVNLMDDDDFEMGMDLFGDG